MIFTFMLGLATDVVSVFVAAHVDNGRRMRRFAKSWHERFMGRPLTPSELLQIRCAQIDNVLRNLGGKPPEAKA